MSRVTAFLLKGAPKRGVEGLTRVATDALRDAYISGECRPRVAPPSPFVRLIDSERTTPPLRLFIAVADEDVGKLTGTRVILPLLEPAGLWRPGPVSGRNFMALATEGMEDLAERLILGLDDLLPYGWIGIWNAVAAGSSGVPAPSGSIGSRQRPHFRGPVGANGVVYFEGRHRQGGSSLPFM